MNIYFQIKYCQIKRRDFICFYLGVVYTKLIKIYLIFIFWKYIFQSHFSVDIFLFSISQKIYSDFSYHMSIIINYFYIWHLKVSSRLMTRFTLYYILLAIASCKFISAENSLSLSAVSSIETALKIFNYREKQENGALALRLIKASSICDLR